MRLNAFLRPDQVVPVVHGVAELFRDQDVLRENRERARMKYLFLKMAGMPSAFSTKSEARLGISSRSGSRRRDPPDDVFRDHVGIHRQKQDGLSYVGASVLRGRISWRSVERRRRAGGQIRHRRSARYRDAEPAADQYSQRENERASQRNSSRLACASTAPHFWRGDDRLHRHGILQAGHHRDQGFCALAGGRDWKQRMPGSTSS